LALTKRKDDGTSLLAALKKKPESADMHNAEESAGREEIVRRPHLRALRRARRLDVPWPPRCPCF
jgi:hypothetical protein